MLSLGINSANRQAAGGFFVVFFFIFVLKLCFYFYVVLPLPGEQVHVVRHAGQALALPHNVVLLLLPLLHLRVHVGRQQAELQTQLGHARLLLHVHTHTYARFSATE